MKNLKIIRNDLSTFSLKVELAQTDQDRMRGLMFRKDMPENQGMFFIFDHNNQNPFWMKNTYLPLDILFIDSSNHIVDIKANAIPLSEELLFPKSEYKMVLEVNAGYTKRHGIKTGDQVILEK